MSEEGSMRSKRLEERLSYEYMIMTASRNIRRHNVIRTITQNSIA